jgi:predicted transposase
MARLFSRKQRSKQFKSRAKSIDNVLNTCYTAAMTQTLLLQLNPTPDQQRLLLETMHAFNAAATYVGAIAFTEDIASKVILQQVAYGDLRARFHLPAQLAIRSISEACEAYKRDKSRAPSFQAESDVMYDGRMMSFKGLMTVSLLTIAGRAPTHFRIIGSRQTSTIALPGRASLRYEGGAFTLEVVSAEIWVDALQDGDGTSGAWESSHVL